MKRISIDGGKTFCTTEHALKYVLFDDVLAAMEPEAREKAVKTPGRKSIFDIVNLYLEYATKDLILG